LPRVEAERIRETPVDGGAPTTAGVEAMVLAALGRQRRATTIGESFASALGRIAHLNLKGANADAG
jgi:hypothetical protein